MARPVKQTVDYFPHIVAGGKTLFILENSYGNDGYSFWFKLLELLGSSEGHYYDCNNIPNWEYLIAKTKVSEKMATEILDKLAELDAIDKELWLEKIVWVQHLVDNVAEVYKKRNARLPVKPVSRLSVQKLQQDKDNKEFSERKPEVSGVSGIGNPQSKVEESKVEESREESDSLSPQSIELCKYYETLKPGQSITTHIDSLKIMIGQYTFEWCKEALQITVSNKKQFIKAYMEGILLNWQNHGKVDNDISSKVKSFKAPVTTFNSYDQRQYDVKDLEKKIFGVGEDTEVESEEIFENISPELLKKIEERRINSEKSTDYCKGG